MILDDEARLIELAENRAEALSGYGATYAYLHTAYSIHQDEIKEMTGKKFVGNDSRPDVVLDWAQKQDEETKNKITRAFTVMVKEGKRAEAINSQMEALSEVLRFRVSKWKNEREAKV